MTINWDETATDEQTADLIHTHLADKLWHDGRRWWAKNLDNQWAPSVQTGYVRLHLLESRQHLPQEPRWDRARRQLTCHHGRQAVLSHLKTRRWTRPHDIPAP